MPVVDVTDQNAVLDGWLGPGRGSTAPDSYDVELWIDDPRSIGATEADFTGYAAASWDSDDWGPAEGGETSTTSVVDCGTPSSESSDAVRWWALRNPVTGELAFCAPLERPVYVSTSATPFRFIPTVRFPGTN